MGNVVSASAAPSHICLIAPQVLSACVPSPNPSPSPRDNPFESPPSSPPLSFYTAPSTPLTSPQREDPPQDSPTHPLQARTSNARPPLTNTRLPPSTVPSCDIETIPPAEALVPPDLALDFTLDDEGLNTLEKIYLFSRSRSAHHRVFISHALPPFLAQVTPLEAVEYVLPLLPNLAMDEDESVKEAFASELVEILWWFLTRCRLVEENPDPGSSNVQQQGSNEEETLISVQAFTPILATLLLSPNGMVSGSARYAVVDLLGRMRQADDIEDPGLGDLQRPDTNYGLFGRLQRQMFEEELIQQLVIGIGRLDASVEDEDVTEIWYDAAARTPAGELPDASTSTRWTNDELRDTAVNPYFPIPASSPSPATSSPASALPPSSTFPPPGVPPFQLDPELPRVDPSPLASIAFRYEAADSGEPQMAESRIDSQTLLPSGVPQPEHQPARQEYQQAAIAAVAAGGSLRFDAQRSFLREVERAGKDPVYWVRREACFAIGALAKIIPEELVVSTLLPLFETLRTDTVWHVRHSSLFALPAVLSRLSSGLRRSVALSTVVRLSQDESPAVRSGVLEALGEVLYSFHTDQHGPPQELLRLFLGREEDGRTSNAFWCVAPSEFDLFYDDPARPLACAFNYPAVAHTLGRARWGELRTLYLALAQNRPLKQFRSSFEALGEGEARDSIFADLVKIWEEGWLRNWRAREAVIKILSDLAGSLAHPDCLHQLLKWGLEDDFGAVREISISVVSRMLRESDRWAAVLDGLCQDILALAYSPSFRKRMT
ncbi:armadillo-type protein [Melanogaster broomeanus]|nr:armadillo-type protein [Melanogaster broomeanus]